MLRGATSIPRTASHAARHLAAAAAPAVPRTPAASISVHKGLKIQAALCVERPPTRVLEPDFKRRWRAFREAWEKRTDNNLAIDDDIVFMRFHFHFLEGGGSGKRAAGSLQLGGVGSVGLGSEADSLVSQSGEEPAGVDALLSQEGLGDLAFPEQGKRKSRRRRTQKTAVTKTDDSDVKSIERLSNRSLFLVTRSNDAKHWAFPKADRAHGEPMRETLLKLCDRQLGSKFSPYIVGACPFTYYKRKTASIPGLDGRKTFYYRARLVPGMAIVPPDDSPVSDWAWCSREELPQYLGEGEWRAVRDTLPLDDL